MMRIIITLLLFLLAKSITAQDAALLQEADNSYRKQDWKSAIATYQKITEVNPYNGRYWYRLAFVALKTGQYDIAIRAGEKASTLYFLPGNAMYNLACAYALDGQTEKALDWLEKAYDNDFNELHNIINDEDLKTLHDTPRFKNLTGRTQTTFASREEGWRYDLQYLIHIFEKYHVNIFHDITPTAWQQACEKLYQSIPSMTDYEITLAMTKLVAMINDGHTNMFPYSNGKMNRLPIEPYLFQDGLFVKSAAPAYKHLIGKKIISIGGISANDLLAKSYEYIGNDNEWQNKMMGPLLLQTGEFYCTQGNIKDCKNIPVILQDHNEKTTQVILETMPWKLDNHSEMLNPSKKDWVYDNATATNPLPLYLQHPEKNYWMHIMEEQQLLYFQFNQVVNQFNHAENKVGETIEAFSKRLEQTIADKPIEALVIDIRNNTGGNGFLALPIIKTIIKSDKINQRGKLFIITGRRTFSAAMEFACKLELWTNAMFIGEPTGSSPINYGEHNPIMLPYSGLMASYSSRYFQHGYSSKDNRPFIAPDIAAELHSSDYFNNIDPAMDAIIKYLKK
ncbi:MAG: hypothetical protein SFU99_15525 [Saprospiraceae bacterium]|nr:hypothetical protein [Saprospiraceae bacterium]